LSSYIYQLDVLTGGPQKQAWPDNNSVNNSLAALRTTGKVTQLTTFAKPDGKYLVVWPSTGKKRPGQINKGSVIQKPTGDGRLMWKQLS
jgi:hypothetical protein